MARRKRKAAKASAKAGARVAPVAGRTAGKAAWKLGKAEAKLIRRAMSSQEPKKTRYLKYGFFLLIGLAIGAAIARSKKGESSDESSSYTGTTGPHAPDPGSPAGERGQTWGSGTPTGTAGGGGQQSPGGANPDTRKLVSTLRPCGPRLSGSWIASGAAPDSTHAPSSRWGTFFPRFSSRGRC